MLLWKLKVIIFWHIKDLPHVFLSKIPHPFPYLTYIFENTVFFNPRRGKTAFLPHPKATLICIDFLGKIEKILLHNLHIDNYSRMKDNPHGNLSKLSHPFPYFDSIEKYCVVGACNVAKRCILYIIKTTFVFREHFAIDRDRRTRCRSEGYRGFMNLKVV